jgi:hypothetical protein
MYGATEFGLKHFKVNDKAFEELEGTKWEPLKKFAITWAPKVEAITLTYFVTHNLETIGTIIDACGTAIAALSNPYSSGPHRSNWCGCLLFLPYSF